MPNIECSIPESNEQDEDEKTNKDHEVESPETPLDRPLISPNFIRAPTLEAEVPPAFKDFPIDTELIKHKIISPSKEAWTPSTSSQHPESTTKTGTQLPLSASDAAEDDHVTEVMITKMQRQLQQVRKKKIEYKKLETIVSLTSSSDYSNYNCSKETLRSKIQKRKT
mmetsp:Transcript_42068/g.64481  ORF Transcript_42068/g.64481 Transcript_42068/m.64481 type:complete len:167 (+) Transcript_42068:3920-4420(+)